MSDHKNKALPAQAPLRRVVTCAMPSLIGLQDLSLTSLFTASWLHHLRPSDFSGLFCFLFRRCGLNFHEGNFIEKAAQRGDLRAAERWLSNAQNAKLEPDGHLGRWMFCREP